MVTIAIEGSNGSELTYEFESEDDMDDDFFK